MLREFSAKQIGCLKDVRLQLSPLHALIGPNDSGKTTLLRAIGTLASAASRSPLKAPHLWSNWTPPCEINALSTQETSYRLASTPNGLFETWQRGDEQNSAVFRSLQELPSGKALEGFSGGVRFVHFDPKSLRHTSGLIPEGKEAQFTDAHGYGLPGIYQNILGRGDDVYQQIQQRLRELFPTVQGLQVFPRTENELSLRVVLRDGTKVPAEEMSEGLLYFLAYAALPWISETSLLLIEEPENGLHPSRVADVVRVLRSLSEQKTQVILATHSPLVINELKGHEVSVITRPSVEEGTRAILLEDTPNFERRASVYALGELWLSYADGRFEEPLLTPVQVAG
jgi:ABC-type branched-subunit amino acid transport system ATPase component